MDGHEAIRKIAKAALRLRDAELQTRLAALQVEAGHHAGQDARLWPRPRGAVARGGPLGRLSFHDDVLWLARGEAEDGPLCPSCWGRACEAVLMQAVAGTWSCPTCRRAVRMPDAPENRPPPGPIPRTSAGFATPGAGLEPRRENP